MKPILPKPPLGANPLSEFATEMAGLMGEANELFAETQSTWKHKAKWTREQQTKPSRIVGKVLTHDDIYGWVNDGTRAHMIRPRTKRALAFQAGSTPKTTPGVIGSGPGGASGPLVLTQVVRHPGGRPRRFDAAVVKEMTPRAIRRLQAAIDRIGAKLR